MPFYTVKMFERGTWQGDACHEATDRPAAIRIANEWAALKGWNPDEWEVYRNADRNNAARYVRNGSGFTIKSGNGESDFARTGKLQRKIDLFEHKPDARTHWTYRASTNHWRTCRDARASAALAWGVPLENIRAQFA